MDNGCQAVTVVAPTCTEAGVLSTVAFVLGREAGMPLLEQAPHVEGCMWSHSELHQTRGLGRYAIAE